MMSNVSAMAKTPSQNVSSRALGLACTARMMVAGRSEVRNNACGWPQADPTNVARCFSRHRRPRLDQCSRRPLEHHLPAVMTGAGAQIDDPVRVRHHRLVMLDHDDRLA
jgi:hypothetical protein